MPASLIAGLVCCGVGIVVLVLVVVARAREWRYGRSDGGHTFSPSTAYALGLWCLPTGIGLMSAGVPGGVLLGVATAVALRAVVIPRSGMHFSGADVRFGTVSLPVAEIATVVRSPKASFGRAYGTWGVTDAHGRWLAAFRPHAARHGATAMHELIRRAGLEPQSDGRTWSRPDAVPPQDPFPVTAR